eukprot:s9251_g1.t1
MAALYTLFYSLFILQKVARFFVDAERVRAQICWAFTVRTKAAAAQAAVAVAPPPAQEKAPSPESGPSTYGLARVTSTVGSGASTPRITAVSGSFAQAPSQKGNPKCWSEGFTFELCCADE